VEEAKQLQVYIAYATEGVYVTLFVVTVYCNDVRRVESNGLGRQKSDLQIAKEPKERSSSSEQQARLCHAS
jgi:hypothetical protein